MKTKLLLGLLLFSTFCFADRKTVSTVITVNGDTVTLDNAVGGMTISIGEVMTGAPTTVSVTVQGCKSGTTPICATLDTNASVGNAIRNIAVTTVYDYFTATAAWTGGTSVSIGFNYTTTTARNGGGGGGGGAVTSVFGRSGDVVALTNDYSFAQIGSKPTTVAGYGITDAVPTARTVNGHALSANIAVTPSDVGNGTAQWNANLLNGVSLAGLGTGIVKNTNGTGVPSIATAADIDLLFTGAGKCYLFKGTTPGTNDGCDTPGGGGTVTSFSSGNLSPLFTTSVSTPTATPALSFTLSNAAANTIFGNCTGSLAAPGYCAILAAMLPGSITSNTSGTAANLSGTPALPNGTTATTQTAGDNTTKLATTAFVLANSSGLPAGPTSPNGVPQSLVSTPSGGVAGTAGYSLSGVPVNNNTETTCATQTLNVLDRATAMFCSGGSTATFTFPIHTTSGFGLNFPMVIYNGNSGNMTLTPTTDTIDRGTLLPAWAVFAYNNASGNWQTNQFPTYNAFGTTCTNGSTWSTTTGFGCLSAAPIKSGDAASGDLSGTYPNPTVTNLTQTTPAPTANQICVYGSTAKTCTPTTTLPTAAEPAHTGDVTNSAGSTVLAIAANAVTLAKMATQANATVLSNVSGGTAVPSANALPTTANALIKTSNANGALAASLTTDDGTTRTYTGTGGDKAPVYTATGTTAGFWDFPQGTTSAAVAPCNVATSICFQAPTAVTSYLTTFPGAAPTIVSYKQTDTCALAACTESFHPTPIVLRVTADFTTAASTGLQAITGLSFTFPINSALNARVECDVLYHQNTAAVADNFGVQDVSVAPTNIEATSFTQTAATTWAEGSLLTLATTTATNFATFTPSAITTDWHSQLHLMVEHPSNAATSVLQLMTGQATAADTITIRRGSSCLVTFQ